MQLLALVFRGRLREADPFPMLLLAHRGASAAAAENTLSAFREAAAQRADGIELDVMRCASGELVVCHDEQLDRLAGLKWVVAATPWWKLKKADVGSRLGFARERIPLLEEVVSALPSHFLLNLELKCDQLEDRGLSVEVARYVARAGLEERTILSSFNPFCLLRVAADQPQLRRGYLLDPAKRFFTQAQLVAPAVSSYSVHPAAQQCTAQRVALWHQRGLKVAAWTVDDPVLAEQLQRWGVDYLITNRPAALRSALHPSERWA